MTGHRAIEAIRNITAETGYPPDPVELADVLDVPRRSLQSYLLPYKLRGELRYDDEGCFVLLDEPLEEAG